MTDWIDVCTEDRLVAGEHIIIDIDGTAVAIFKLGKQFYAVEDVCSHDGSEIASGLVDGDEIICPRHGARFCLKTGEAKCAPAYENIATFPIQIKNKRVQVRDNRWD